MFFVHSLSVHLHILPVKISGVNSPYIFDLNVKISTVGLQRLEQLVLTQLACKD
jgi:hypothetical protein